MHQSSGRKPSKKNSKRSSEKSWDPQNTNPQRAPPEGHGNRTLIPMSVQKATHRSKYQRIHCCKWVNMCDALDCRTAMSVGILFFCPERRQIANIRQRGDGPRLWVISRDITARSAHRFQMAGRFIIAQGSSAPSNTMYCLCEDVCV